MSKSMQDAEISEISLHRRAPALGCKSVSAQMKI